MSIEGHSLEVGIIDTTRDLVSSLALLQKKYSERGYLPRMNELSGYCHPLELHERSMTMGVWRSDNQKLIGRLGFVTSSKEQPLSLPCEDEESFKQLVIQKKEECETIGEATGLAVDDHDSLSSDHSIPLYLYGAGIAALRQRRIDAALMVCHHRHARAYGRLLRAEFLAEVPRYSSVGNEGVLLCFDAKNIQKIHTKSILDFAEISVRPAQESLSEEERATLVHVVQSASRKQIESALCETV